MIPLPPSDPGEPPAAPEPAFTARPPDGLPLHRFTHDAMACTWGIHVLTDSREYARQAARAAFDEIDRIENELSRFVEHSDIARINRLRPGQSLRIGPDAFACLALAMVVHHESGGVFDVTVGSRVRQRFDRGQPIIPSPGSAELADTSASPTEQAPIGMRLLHLDRDERTVCVDAEGLVVDLGAVGKGYAVDQAAQILRHWRIEAGLIHSGQSTLLALGAPPGTPAWRVALRHPLDPSATLGSIELRDAALAGSGHAVHGPHIIDPRSGAASHPYLGTWAVAPSAAIADAVSTAFMLMTPAAVALFCCRSPEISALLATCKEPDVGHRTLTIAAEGAAFAGLERSID